MKRLFTLTGTLLFTTLLFTVVTLADTPGSNAPTAEKFPLDGPKGFIENKGQFRDQNGNVRTDMPYMFLRKGLKVQLLENSISFELFTLEDDQKSVEEATGFMIDHDLDIEDRPAAYVRYTSNKMDVEFIGANPHPQMIAADAYPDYLNYYLSFTPEQGIRDVQHYNKITYKDLYPNIDLVLIASPDQYPSRTLAYDFVVHPGGNVHDIRYRYHGANEQQLYENGTLESAGTIGQLFEAIPESYTQSKAGVKLSPVSAAFKKENGVISFDVNHYDKNQALVIDPIVTWATYCGGLLSDEGRGLAVDSEDHVIMIGRTYSTENIATFGAYQSILVGDVDMMLEKYYSDGSRVWGTYYGGSGLDRGRGVIVDHDENIFLGCHTTSPDGCTTVDSWRPTFCAVEDALLARFNPNGYRDWATYYGGAGEDIIRRLAFDSEGAIVMVGYSDSDTGIATPGVHQEVLNGKSDVILSKWTHDEGDRVWGTYLGGESTDHGRSVFNDKYDQIYVNGSTGSQFGIAKNAVRKHNAGGQDYLLAKFGKTGTLKWCSYWGGDQEDRGRGVYVDQEGTFVYFIGYSASDTGVALPGAFQNTWSEAYDPLDNPFHDAVIMKWDADGNPVWSTYIGDKPDDRGRAVTMIDNDIYLGGTTSSTTIMATDDGFQPEFGGNEDMFVEKFTANGNRVWGSYFGSLGSESCLALAVDNEKQHIFMVGTTTSPFGIATTGVAQEVFGGFDDALLLKVALDTAVGISSPSVANQEMNIYPDPNRGEFSVAYKVNEASTLTVTDIRGKVIYSQTLNAGQQKADVANMKAAPGFYNCSIITNGKTTATRKFIIVK